MSTTWHGCDFSDAAGDSAVWSKARQHILGPAVGVAFTVLLSWLDAEARIRLGLPP